MYSGQLGEVGPSLELSAILDWGGAEEEVEGLCGGEEGSQSKIRQQKRWMRRIEATGTSAIE